MESQARRALQRQFAFSNTGAAKRLGKVDDGTTTTDYEPEEVKRKLSIGTALAACEWQDYKLNLLDTPGYPDFVGEVKVHCRQQIVHWS